MDTVGEAHEFAKALGVRFLLWLRDSARAGYIGTGMGNELRTLGCEPLYFDDGDLDSCVLALASSDWVEALRATAWGTRAMMEKMNESLPPGMRMKP